MTAFSDWVEKARAEHVSTVLKEHNIELPGRGSNRAGPCPLCGGTDRFGVDLQKQLFNCRQCGGRGRGAISLTMFLDGVSFLQAVETLTGSPPPAKEPKAPGAKPGKRGSFE